MVAPLTFEIDTSGLAEAFAAADVMLQFGVTSALIEGLDQGVEVAKATHAYQDQSGELTASIHRDGLTLVASSEHASFVEEGTSAHPIDPVNAKVLRWEPKGGGVRFARHVDHPGTKPLPFMQPAAEYAAEVAVQRIESELVPAIAERLGK